MRNDLRHFLSLFIVLLSLTSVAQKVDIPDYWFRMYLKYQLPELMDRNQLDVAKAKAYAGEMDCSNSKIRSLEGIEYFESLRKLDCSNNWITELDLSNLTKLEELDCSNNRLESISGFRKTDALKKFVGTNNRLKDFENLKVQKDLEEVDLRNNKSGYLRYETYNDISSSSSVKEFTYKDQDKFGQKIHKNGKKGETVTLEMDRHSKVTSYQWKKDGQILTGKTDRKLELANFDENDEGEYDVNRNISSC